MNDVSKCTNKDCRLNHLCYRFMSNIKGEKYQWYGQFTPYIDSDNKLKCDFFINNFLKIKDRNENNV